MHDSSDSYPCPMQGSGGRTCQATALLSRTKVSSSGCSPDWSSLPPPHLKYQGLEG